VKKNGWGKRPGSVSGIDMPLSNACPPISFCCTPSVFPPIVHARSLALLTDRARQHFISDTFAPRHDQPSSFTSPSTLPQGHLPPEGAGRHGGQCCQTHGRLKDRPGGHKAGSAYRQTCLGSCVDCVGREGTFLLCAYGQVFAGSRRFALISDGTIRDDGHTVLLGRPWCSCPGRQARGHEAKRAKQLETTTRDLLACSQAAFSQPPVITKASGRVGLFGPPRVVAVTILSEMGGRPNKTPRHL
jgi:hypothetical protein